MMPSVAEIRAAVAHATGISEQLMLGPRRQREIVRARHIAMYLAYRLTPQSYSQIARAFGGRDHTTIMHAVDKVSADAELRTLAESIGDAIDPTGQERVTPRALRRRDILGLSSHGAGSA